MTDIIIRKAMPADLETILSYIRIFNLDGENIDSQQFVVAEVENKIVGFGRIKPYESLYELSSVGVLEEYRRKGVGKKLIEYLIDIFPSEQVWVATKIADYFKKFGFKISDNPPEELKGKSSRVCSKFSRSTEKVCFMLLEK